LGSERESAAVRPLASAEQQYCTAATATQYVTSPPRLFENRHCFRLLGVDWLRPAVQLDFGAMGFFDAIDTNEALADETRPEPVRVEKPRELRRPFHMLSAGAPRPDADAGVLGGRAGLCRGGSSSQVAELGRLLDTDNWETIGIE
jgi:hypothetical protein